MLSYLLLADSRLPSGGHGHSGGVEALVDRGQVELARVQQLHHDPVVAGGEPAQGALPVEGPADGARRGEPGGRRAWAPSSA